MELLNIMLLFFNNILDIKIFDNISLLELLLYLLFVGIIVKFLKIAVKGKK